MHNIRSNYVLRSTLFWDSFGCGMYYMQCLCLLKVFWCPCSGRDMPLATTNPRVRAQFGSLRHILSNEQVKLRTFWRRFFFNLEEKFGPLLGAFLKKNLNARKQPTTCDQTGLS